MATNRAVKKVQPKNKTKKQKKKVFKCSECPKTFSKKSNLTTHVKSKHFGKKWVCPFCEKEQSSKFSHIRHVEKCKQRKKREYDPDENVYLMLYNTDLSPESKSFLIKNLEKRDKKKSERIKDLNQKLFLALKTIIGLKKELSQDSKQEEDEISNLVKASTEDDEEDSYVHKVPKRKQKKTGKPDNVLIRTIDFR